MQMNIQLKNWSKVVQVSEQIEAIRDKLQAHVELKLGKTEMDKMNLRKGRGLLEMGRFVDAKETWVQCEESEEVKRWLAMADAKQKQQKEKEKMVYQRMFG